MLRAFQKAISRRNPNAGLLVHSDRVVQYASKDFSELLKEKGFIQSMSRKGNCWDNAVAESFFHTLKTQLIFHRRFLDSQEAEQALFNYIEAYYNRRRRHSSNGYQSPAMYEDQWLKLKKWLNYVSTKLGENQTKRALAEYLATEQARLSAQIALVSVVARVYLVLAKDRENLKLAQETLTIQQGNYNLIKCRYDVGVVTELDLQRAGTRVDAAKRDLAGFIRNIARDQN